MNQNERTENKAVAVEFVPKGLLIAAAIGSVAVAGILAATGKLPIQFPGIVAEANADSAALVPDMKGSLPKSAYRNDENREAAAAYSRALEEFPKGKVTMVDLDRNGVAEMIISEVPESLTTEAIYYMNYEQDEEPYKIYKWDAMDACTAEFALIPGREQFMITNYSGMFDTILGDTYSLSESGLARTEKCVWSTNTIYDPEDPCNITIPDDELRHAENSMKDIQYLIKREAAGITEEDLLYPSELADVSCRETDRHVAV